MKHKVKVDVVTEKKGFFGKCQVVEKRTITVNGREYRKLKQEQFRKEQENRELTEQQRLAALWQPCTCSGRKRWRITLRSEPG